MNATVPKAETGYVCYACYVYLDVVGFSSGRSGEQILALIPLDLDGYHYATVP